MWSEPNSLPTKPARYSRMFWWGGAVICLILGLLFWAELKPERWERLGVTQLKALFLDLGAILASGQAQVSGIDPYHAPNPFDTYGRPHVYGPGWLLTGSLGLTVEDTFWLGSCLIVVFLVSMVRLFRVDNIRSAICLLVLLASPPLMCALNRANNDLVILLMLMGAAWLSDRRPHWAPYLAMLLVGVAALLKFYPLALLPALLTMRGNWRRHVIYLGALLAVLVVAFALQWCDYSKAFHMVPGGKTIFAYQASYAFELLVIIFRELPARTWVGALIASVLVGTLIWRSRTAWHVFLPTTGRWGFLMVGATSVWCACLLAGPSFSYRFIWLLPLVAYSCCRLRRAKVESSALLILIACLGWAWWPKHAMKNLLQADVPGADVLFMNALGFEQVFVLGSLLVCLWVLAGWLWRRLGELTRAEAKPPSSEGE